MLKDKIRGVGSGKGTSSGPFGTFKGTWGSIKVRGMSW
jgi:hypothetical protein